HREVVQEAGRRIHRRSDGPAGTAHGTRGRHHRGREGDGGGEGGGAHLSRCQSCKEPCRHRNRCKEPAVSTLGYNLWLGIAPPQGPGMSPTDVVTQEKEAPARTK